MPTEYFEARERALLGQRYETLYAAPSDSAARGVTVSALRTTPGTFAAKADMALEPSPFCKAAFVVREETFKPGRHPYHHAGVFYSQEPSAASAAPLLGVKPGMRVLDLCAAPGGQLVYSTCTFAPEEDEGQVAAFLQRHPEFTLADALGNVDYTFGSEGEANRTGGLPLDVTRVRRVWPCQGGEGHFMARLVKAGTPRALPAPGEYSPEEQLWLEAAAQAGKKAGKGKGKPAKSFDKADARSARREASRSCHEAVQGRNTRTRDAGAGEATPAQSLAAWQEFAARYFPALAQRPAVVHGGGVLLPAPFPQTTLHVLRAGVFVGSVQKGRFVPEHHLFTAFGAQCTNREELTLTDPRTVEYLSGREIEARTAADGWCCVTVDGWPLGGGKVSGGRVKNHYPKALRLL